MKILVLRFKNIHSLKGQQVIDFTKSPLSDSGLFAITGPTGAGKSTILDVITLALFNKIPRFAPKGTESISKTDIERFGSLMTHYTDDAYAEIEYECRGQQYRSKWSIIRKKGKLRDYEMELATLPDGIILDLKKSKIPAENELILGLKYEQFIRSILLSQGDFARFLKSDDKERAKLLEDITASHIYREIGKKVYADTKVKEEEIQLLRQKSDMITFHSDETIVKMKDEIDGNNLQTDNISGKINILNIEYQNRLNLNQQIVKLDTAIEARGNLDIRMKEFESSAIQLRKHQELQPIISDINLWSSENQKYTDLIHDQSQIVKKIAELDETKKSIIEVIYSFLHQPVTESDILDALQIFESQIQQIDLQLQQWKLQGENQRNILNETCAKYKHLDWVNQMRNLKSFDLQLQFTDNLLINNKQREIHHKGSDHALKSDIQSISEGLYKLSTKVDDALLFEKLTNSVTLSVENVQKLTIDLIKLQSKKSSLETSALNLKKELSVLQSEKEQMLKMTKLEDLRQTLIDGDPCPLCGSIHHPYSSEHFATDLGKMELEIQFTSQKLSSQETEVKLLSTQVTRFESDLKHAQGLIDTNNETIQNIRNKWQNKLETSDEITKIKVGQETLLSHYRQEETNRLNQEALMTIKLILENMIEIFEKYKDLQATRKAMYIGETITEDTKKLRNQYLQNKDIIVSLNANQRSTNEHIDQIKESIESRLQKILVKTKPLGYDSIKQVLPHVLSDHIYQSINTQQQELTRLDTEMKTKIINLNEEISLIQKSITTEQTIESLKSEIEALQLQKDQLNLRTGALQNELKLQDKKIKESEALLKLLVQKEKEASPLFQLNFLIGDATGTKYAKYAQNLSLKHLIQLANRRMAKLTDRYLLVPTDIEDDLRILDIYQGNTERSVKTLSGGETFIVSLAMALSLADMSAKNVKIESLFIDEGFGTLDEETLETALITLERLQSESSRTIGIISHVESLKERITTQIKVSKSHLGYSEIQIVG